MDDAFKYGKVVSVVDTEDGDRVRAYIKGEDPSDYKTKDIPYAFPLLPKHLSIKPQVGELVLIFRQSGKSSDDRFYIGPIISQPDKLGSDTLAPDAFLKGGIMTPGIAPSTIPENKGLQPDPSDIALFGRGSTDIIQKKNEIQIRAGKSVDLKKFNRNNLTYIQLKHELSTGKGQINVVSDNINFLSHSGSTKFNLCDPDTLITDEEYEKILKEAQQIPLGNKLVEFLILQQKAFATHVHPYPGMAPDATQIEVKNYLNYDLTKVLSQNFRCN